MKPQIRQRAVELGFEACRFTSALPPDTALYFDQWLQAGSQGEMAYLSRTAAKRLDPQLVLAGVKSVIVLAASYAVSADVRAGQIVTPTAIERPVDPSPINNRSLDESGENTTDAHAPTALIRPASEVVPPPARGRIARYARERDYHAVLGKKLQELTLWIDQVGAPGARSLWYIDTGPILERDLAQRAGLGFIGKHTNLISRQFGNWIFLAEILTTLDLEPDLPEPNRCGTCAKCISACPTQAIYAPFQLDPRRCISYLTIELKGPIPEEFRSAIGNRIFGCDDCLEVCPWNRFARVGRLMREQTRPDLGALDLLGLLTLDEAAFKRHFADTPIQRIKRRGLLRNVCVALGNVGDNRALPALHRAAQDAEPLIAEPARWAIEQITRRQSKLSP